MGILLLIMKAIAVIVGVTSAAFGIGTLGAAFTFKDWKLTLTVIYALVGWFIIGMCVGSLWG